MSTESVKREILVRHLENWAPAALHHARRATYVHGYADGSAALVEAALNVFTEQSDLVRGRELTMVALGEEAVKLPAAGAAGLTVHSLGGGTDARLAVAVKAVGASGVPLLGFLDASATEPPGVTMLSALNAGKPAEALVVLAPGESAARGRATLTEAGFPLVAAVELTDSDDPGQTILYATARGKSLEAFKDVLWEVDEFAGVRYRDPADPSGHPLDIALEPHPGPLRREILATLEREGPRSVTELRTFALTATVYRASDVTRVLHMLLDAGLVTRRPEQGRLGGDVVISL